MLVNKGILLGWWGESLKVLKLVKTERKWGGYLLTEKRLA
jgi:hypothetical protein